MDSGEDYTEIQRTEIGCRSLVIKFASANLLLQVTMTDVPPQYNTYTTPLTSRYASPEMCKLFSPATRHSTWRKLWLDLARAEKELGLEIPEDAINQMEQHLELTLQDWKTAEQEEKVRRYRPYEKG